MPKADSDAIRRHAYEKYVFTAHRRKQRMVAINVGEVHRELALNNRVPLVCSALSSKKFLTEHGLRLVSRTGPPSGQSTTVTFTYEIVKDNERPAEGLDAFLALRGIGKELFASLGHGENFLRRERAEFSRAMERREAEGAPPKR